MSRLMAAIVAVLAAIWLGIDIAIAAIMAPAVIGAPEVKAIDGLAGIVMGRGFASWGAAGYVVLSLLLGLSAALAALRWRQRIRTSLLVIAAVVALTAHGISGAANQQAGELRRTGQADTPAFDAAHRTGVNWYLTEAASCLVIVVLGAWLCLHAPRPVRPNEA